MGWLNNQLQNCMLYRRILVLITLTYIWHSTYDSKALAIYAMDKAIEWHGIVAILGAYTGLPLAAMGYLFHKYDKARTEK
jgi:hypothetical protein